MAKKKATPTAEATPAPVVDQLNDGWQTVVGEGGQIELVQSDPVPSEEASGQVTGGNGNGHQPESASDAWATLGKPLLVPISSIQPNPYQPRTAEDPAAIEEIAVSIYRNGLMQIPAARANGALFQLAFGHTRLAAFVLLATKGMPQAGIPRDRRFEFMPLRIVELDDQQMFEVAVAENLKRRQLNTIEQAAAMKRYMEEFNASSRQAGELFGMNDTTVRGVVRLLQLPEGVQEQIGNGALTQTDSRKLLSVIQIAPPETIEMMANDIVNGTKPDSAIATKLRGADNVVVLREAWQRDEEIHAGDGLWLIGAECNPASLSPLSADKMTTESVPKTRAKYYLETLQGDPTQECLDRLITENPSDVDVIERIAHLLRPPACAACPFYVKSNGTHMCGLKLCHKRKSQAWAEAEMLELTTETGVRIYNAATDGKMIVPAPENSWQDETTYKAFGALWGKKSPDLRLQAHRSGSYKARFTRSVNVRVIVVGEAAQHIKDLREKKDAERESAQVQRQEQWKLERTRMEASDKFLKNVTLDGIFAPVFDEMTNAAAMCSLLDQDLPKDKKKSAVLAELRLELAKMAIDNHITWQLREQGPVALITHMRSVATTWGVEFPADLVELAKQFEPGAVSTETPKAKKKKAAAATEEPVEPEDDVDDEMEDIEEEDSDDDDD